jgi:ERF superfamily.
MKTIYKALANFQQEVPVILKETSGYGYKYADLPKILEIINPLLKKINLDLHNL